MAWLQLGETSFSRVMDEQYDMMRRQNFGEELTNAVFEELLLATFNPPGGMIQDRGKKG